MFQETVTSAAELSAAFHRPDETQEDRPAAFPEPSAVPLEAAVVFHQPVKAFQELSAAFHGNADGFLKRGLIRCRT